MAELEEWVMDRYAAGWRFLSVHIQGSEVARIDDDEAGRRSCWVNLRSA